MENVGYSKENKIGIYNIQMIEERQTIIALGADAVSKIIFMDENRIERSPNVKDVIEYTKEWKKWYIERKNIRYFIFIMVRRNINVIASAKRYKRFIAYRII